MEWRVCCHCSSCSTAPHGWTCCRSPESELSPQVEAEMDGGGGLDGEEGRETNSPPDYRLTRQISLIRLALYLRINFVPPVCLVQQLRSDCSVVCKECRSNGAFI